MAPNSMSEAGPSGCVVKTKKNSEGKKRTFLKNIKTSLSFKSWK